MRSRGLVILAVVATAVLCATGTVLWFAIAEHQTQLSEHDPETQR